MSNRPNRVRRGALVALSLAALGISGFAVRPQAQAPAAAAAPAPVINQSTDPLLAGFRFRSIGPASMGGRIDDIAVSETDPNIIYSATPSAASSSPRTTACRSSRSSRTYGTASIGDIAIHPRDPNIVYVGTAKPTTGRPRRSATASTRRPTAARPSRTSD
jgi:hypothetical protein